MNIGIKFSRKNEGDQKNRGLPSFAKSTFEIDLFDFPFLIFMKGLIEDGGNVFLVNSSGDGVFEAKLSLDSRLSRDFGFFLTSRAVVPHKKLLS